ncbi:hypothetical protein LOD99_4396 [Oopsacas minuta]|uniref:ECSIT N-terminal domain-containing protein n=1 Tax=Oopsacas minuta TaxID=111878 RepID=A0AAV7JUP0_9METZ|nr:hypothetical protein LOD99_4396 [Oopsacas minuta]
MYRLVFSNDFRHISRLRTILISKTTPQPQRYISTTPVLASTSNNPKHQLIASQEILENALTDFKLETELTKARSMQIWTAAMTTFRTRDRFNTGFMIFIENAMNRMEELNVDLEVEAYNQLLDCFPKDKYVTRTYLDIIFPPPYPAMELSLDILTKMEEKGIRPNDNTFSIVYKGFGRASLPLLKCNRIMYWFDRFENHDPYSMKGDIPYTNPLALFDLTCSRIFQEFYQPKHLTVFLEDTNSAFKYVYGYESDSIRKSCESFDPVEKDLIIEGPHLMWLQKHKEHYFTVRELAKNRAAEDEGEVLAIGLTGSGCVRSLEYFVEKLSKKYSNIADATPFYSIKEPDVVKGLVVPSDVFLESDVENLTTV